MTIDTTGREHRPAGSPASTGGQFAPSTAPAAAALLEPEAAGPAYGRDADALRAHVAALPEWRPDLDDDPAWVRPMGEFAVIDPLRHSPLLAAEVTVTEESAVIDAGARIYTRQLFARLDAIAHYLDARDELFDPDGLYGTDHPVVLPWQDGYVALDGNHRLIADRLMGRPTRVIIAELV